jgi:hypothetical protein
MGMGGRRVLGRNRGASLCDVEQFVEATTSSVVGVRQARCAGCLLSSFPPLPWGEVSRSKLLRMDAKKFRDASKKSNALRTGGHPG